MPLGRKLRSREGKATDPPLTLEQVRRQRAALMETIRRIIARFGPGLTDFGIRQTQDELLKVSSIMVDAIVRATVAMRADATARQILVRALRDLNPEAARAAFAPGLERYRISLTNSKALREGIEIAFEGGTIMAGGDIAETIGVIPSLDPLAPSVADFLERHKVSLIREVSHETRLAINESVGRAFTTAGGAPRDVAVPIREILTTEQSASHLINTSGLTRRQSRAVDRYLDGLLGNGVPRREAIRRAKQYADRQLRYRAMNISRTEILRTANAGHQSLFEQGLDQGLLNPITHRKVWITSADDRVCPICSPMNGKTVAIIQNFAVDFPRATGIGKTENRKHPPAHPSCRCTMAIQEVPPGLFPDVAI
jgi:hypothetical protein